MTYLFFCWYHNYHYDDKLGYNIGGVNGIFGKNTDAANTAYMAYHSTGSIAPVYTGGSTSPSYIRNGSTTPYITAGGSSTPKVNVMAGGIGGSTTPAAYKTYDKNGKTQTTSFFSVVKNFGEGLGEAVEDTAKGVANVATHPKEVVNGIEYAVSHPAETVNAIKNETVKTYSEFKNGDANTKAKILGDITGEVALSAIGTKGIDKAVKAVKEAGVIARTAEAAETVSDATKAASVAEKATATAVKEVTTQTVEKATFDELREVARFLKESVINNPVIRRNTVKAFNSGAKVAAESKVSAAAEEVGALESSNVIKGTVNSYKEVNIHGKINTELDEVDLVNKVIYEDKPASKLYMENPDVPQTEAQWALKQIFRKGSNRIDALQQADFKLSSKVSPNLPSEVELSGIKDYVFRIDADTPQLRAAVQNELNNLKAKYPDYNFSATYGGKK